MPTVDFYILPDADRQSRIQLAYRLIDKAYQQRHRVYVQVDTEAQARYLDEGLWIYPANPFLPHERVEQQPHPATPVLIGYGDMTSTETDILLNLSTQIPPYYQQFQRILELGNQEPQQLQQLRQRYRFYQNQQYEISHHRL